MSRHYRMDFDISECDETRVDGIITAINDHYGITLNPAYGDPTVLTGDGEYTLTGGQSEQEFADEATVLIWAANGKPCRVVIHQYYLEAVPFEVYAPEMDDARLLKRLQWALEDAKE